MTEPPEFVAVRTYVRVLVGETETLVPVTVPMPEMLRVVALLVDQENTALWP